MLTKLAKIFLYFLGAFMILSVILSLLGYEINRQYFQAEAKQECQQQIKTCHETLQKYVLFDATCQFSCLKKLIIKRDN